MKTLLKKAAGLVCSAALMLTASFSALTANALDNNIYLADAHPHYRHPVTGVIEDSGDFITSVEVRHDDNNNNDNNNNNNDNNGGYDDNGDQPVQTTAPAQTTAQTTTTTTTKKADEDSSELESSLAETTTTTTAKASDESVKGLGLYDENGSRIDNESSAVNAMFTGLMSAFNSGTGSNYSGAASLSCCRYNFNYKTIGDH